MTPEFLRANLCFLHGTMTASEGLLREAIYHSKGELSSYFAKHLVEEIGHLEMLESELKGLGVTTILPFRAAAQVAGAQYYYIKHEHPAILLGYMRALESMAPTAPQLAELEAEHGALNCTRHHALHDPGHVADLEIQIDKLDAPLPKAIV